MTTKELILEKLNSINQTCIKKNSEYRVFHERIRMLEKIISDHVCDLVGFVNNFDPKEWYLLLPFNLF